MLKQKIIFNFQKPVTTLLPMTSQWRFDKQERRETRPQLKFLATPLCPPDSSSSRTARQHTQRTAHRTGCGPTVQISAQKTNGLQIRRMYPVD